MDTPAVTSPWVRSGFSAAPILRWLPGYHGRWLRADLVAGLTLAAYAIPVSVAYASLAGLPPQAGLYCYLVGGVAYATLGTSRQLAVGPTSAISMVIAAALGPLAVGDASRQAHLAMSVAVLTGFVGLLAWGLQLGNVTNFVSETVLSGYKVGAGLVIASTQLPKLFGIKTGGGNFFTRLFEIAKHTDQVNVPTLCVGLGALALLILGERLYPRRPVALLVVAIAIVVMSYSPLARLGVKTVGLIPRGLPALTWPVIHWSEVDDLLAVALACFLLSYVESISVIRTFATKRGYRICSDQELLALGVANIAAGVLQGYPVAGGMSQSAVNEKAGAQTPLAVMISSAAICVVLLYLTAMMQNLPEPVLAAIVLVAVKGLIRPTELRHLYAVARVEFRVAMLATAGVLAFGILKGVLLASLFSILVLLKRASRPRISLLHRLPQSDRFVDASRYPESVAVPQALILRVEAGLFYFNAQNVKDEVMQRLLEHRGVEQLIIDLSSSANMDLAGARMLAELNNELAKAGVSLSLAEVHGCVRDLLHAEGIHKNIVGIIECRSVASLIDCAHPAASE